MFLGPGQRVGGGKTRATRTNDNAKPGTVGEFISSDVPPGTVSLTTGVTVNVTSILLTPGDWDVSYMAAFQPGPTTSYTVLLASISTTSLAFDTASVGNFAEIATPAEVTGGPSLTTTVGPRRMSLSKTTTVFAVVQAAFTASTMTTGGILRARRMR